MKKYWILLLVFFPVVSFAVPSVRMLGSNPALTSSVKSRITPVKAENKTEEKSLNSSTSRIGSIKAKALQATQSTKDTRFPVVVSGYSYNTVDKPEQGQNGVYNSGGTTTNVDVATIIEAVTQNIANNYYNKTEVYNTTEVYNKEEIDAKLDNQILDDPRFDAIRIVRGRNGSVPSDSDYPTNLPSNYIYMWIEED